MATKDKVAEARLAADEKAELEQLAAEQGITLSEALRRGARQVLGAEPDDTRRERGDRVKWTWCLRDFLTFARRLELPESTEEEPQPVGIEPWARLVLADVFAPGRVAVLCLIPKGNGKTTIFAALAVFHLLITRNANCFIGAADKEQADEMFRFAQHFAGHDFMRGHMYVRESTRRILATRDQGFIRVLASDSSKAGGKKQGFNPTLALIDELHAHENDNLYVAMRSGLFKRKGRMVTITTAGHDEEDSTLGILRAGFLELDAQGGSIQRSLRVDTRGKARKSRNGRLTIARSKGGKTVMFEWACRTKDDLSDLKIVKLANPAGFVTVDSLQDALEEPGITPAQFARYRANVWAQGDDAVIPEADWDALNDGAKIPPDADVWVAVDAAQKRDSSAVTQLWVRPDGMVVPEAHVWVVAPRRAGAVTPPAHTVIRDRTRIGQSVLRDFIRQIPKNGRRVLGIVYDDMYFGESAEILADDGFDLVEFDTGNPVQVPASQALYDAICTEPRIAHDGDPVLRSHVLAAAAKPVGEGWRFSKAASKKRIDALFTLEMGLTVVLEEPTTVGFEW